MITGLHIDISSDELKELLLGRQKYHQNKVTAYEKQLDVMKKAEALLDEEREDIGKVSNRTPAESLESSLKKHANQVVYFTFMADHVVPNETYRLNESDLHRLGVNPDRY
jgi:hypothetical protein